METLYNRGGSGASATLSLGAASMAAIAAASRAGLGA